MPEETVAEQKPKGEAARLVEKLKARTRIPLFLPFTQETIYVRAPRLPDLIRIGRVPELLTGAAIEGVDGVTQDEEQVGRATLARMSEEDADRFMHFVYGLVAAVCVEPRMIYEPDNEQRVMAEGEMDVREMPDDDLFHVFRWALPMMAAREGKGVTRADAGSFREDAGLSEDSGDSGDVRAEGGDADARASSSAGA